MNDGAACPDLNCRDGCSRPNVSQLRLEPESELLIPFCAPVRFSVGPVSPKPTALDHGQIPEPTLLLGLDAVIGLQKFDVCATALV
jgi:hypothetical protein